MDWACWTAGNTFSVAKSELSILYNLEEFLNLKTSLDKATIIHDIRERRKKRISKGRILLLDLPGNIPRNFVCGNSFSKAFASWFDENL